MKDTIFCCCIPLFLFTNSSFGQFNRLDPKTKNGIEAKMNQFMTANQVIGASVGVIKGDEIAYFSGFGYEDLDNKIPATEYTMFRSGSICKSFTAVAALQLYEQTKLDIQADVRNYVPEYPVKPQGTITAYRLLCHRSGIRHYEQYDTTLMLNYENTYFDFDAIAALDIFKNGTLKFQPGTAYNYTTFGYNLLGAVVERAGAQQFEFQVRDRIAHVADMPFVQPEYDWRRPYPNESKGYDFQSGPLKETVDIVGIKYKVPGGGYTLTAIDLTLFMKGLMDSSFFTDKSLVSWMQLDHSGGSNYGLGIFTETRNGRMLLHHGGGGPKTYSWYMYYPDSNDGIVVMTNTYLTDVKGLCMSLLDTIANATVSGAPYTHIPHVLADPVLTLPANKDTVYTSAVLLKWNTVPFAYSYRVETSTDSAFSSFAVDTVSANQYSTMNLVANTKYFWRVKALNLYLYDTTTSMYSTVFSFYYAPAASTITRADDSPFKLFPNPFSDEVFLSGVKKDFNRQSLLVYNVEGKQVSDCSYVSCLSSGDAILDLSSLASGIYILKYTEGENIYVKKLVKR